MSSPNQIKKEIDSLVGYLVEKGLSIDQNFALRRDLGGFRVEITFAQATHVSAALGDLSYPEIYDHLAQERAYNVRLPDGALLQLMYTFTNKTLERHRLAFFPSPHLVEFQSNSEIYINEHPYVDIVAKNIVVFPLRFDYDCREGVPRVVEHPKAHLTLGQYRNCRIPVTAPLAPGMFVDFVLRHFYHTAHRRYANDLPAGTTIFKNTIIAAEERLIHVRLPGRTPV
jgi:hypothetical protein